MEIVVEVEVGVTEAEAPSEVLEVEMEASAVPEAEDHVVDHLRFIC